MNNPNRKVIPNGAAFSRWTVIGPAENNKHGDACFQVKCRCGTVKVVAGWQLRRNARRSCGCLNREMTTQKQVIRMEGKIFGLWTVLSSAGSRRPHPKTRTNNRSSSMYWNVQCKCGAKRVVDGGSLRAGKRRRCGCNYRHLPKARGAKSGTWKGGRSVLKTGYIHICKRVVEDTYPGVQCRTNGMKEHHAVMCYRLGRALRPKETVHHKNGIRDDNRIENLELWSTSQPPGQRVEDKLKWAKEFIELYSK